MSTGIPSSMRALVTKEPKTAEVQEIPVPKPAEGEILVKVHYAAQNPTDWKAMAGAGPGRVIGCDFAGTIADPNGSEWRLGQRVAGFVQGTSTSRGAFAEYVVVEASLVFAVPEQISYQDAAAVPLAFATAVQALFQRLGLPEPSKPAGTAFPVLINGGASSVGKYAIQLAKLAGLYVIATGSSKNHELLRQLGADATVDYNDGDWASQARKLTHDNLQHALDTIVTGTVQSVAKAMSPTKPSHIVTILPINDQRPAIAALNPHVKIESTIVYTVFDKPLRFYASVFDNVGEATPADRAFWEKYLALLPDLLESGRLRPNRVRELGGLRDILAGFREQSEGRVSAEKLVYKIAE